MALLRDCCRNEVALKMCRYELVIRCWGGKIGQNVLSASIGLCNCRSIVTFWSSFMCTKGANILLTDNGYVKLGKESRRATVSFWCVFQYDESWQVDERVNPHLAKIDKLLIALGCEEHRLLSHSVSLSVLSLSFCVCVRAFLFNVCSRRNRVSLDSDNCISANTTLYIVFLLEYYLWQLTKDV